MQDLLNKIDRLLKEKKFFEVKNIVKDENAADLAVLFDELFGEVFGEKTEFMILFRLLPKDLAAETFAQMKSDMQSHLIQMFSDKEIRDILDESFIDDTVDIIEEMPANVVSRILNEILRYPKDSAGSIMTIEYVSLHKDMTVSEAFEKIRKVGVNKETIYTCYVTENRKLIGVITVKDLFMADEDDKIADIMETHIISVDTLEDKEIVGHMFRKYDFLALPVVDKDNRLVGIVTFDDAMDVIEEETTEDFSKMAAVAPSDDSYFKTSVFTHAKNRIAWLLILMLSATLTGAIVNKYQSAFAAVPVLVSFLSMLSGTGGNCGSQTSTLVIRGMALGEIRMKDFFKVMWKEFRVALLCSIILAIVNAIRIILVYHGDTSVDCYKLAFTVSMAIMATVVLSKLIACMLPMAAKKLHLDPAIMAAPLITTIVDTCSTLIFFTLATIVFDIK